eukprot:4736050-Pleurochrysis_carterae.AAC.2
MDNKEAGEKAQVCLLAARSRSMAITLSSHGTYYDYRIPYSDYPYINLAKQQAARTVQIINGHHAN